MIDIHSHILPGVDDGPRDFEESAQMLQLASEAGTRAIVATPHADLRYRFEPQRCSELLEQLRSLHPQGPFVHLGCEVHLTPENIHAVLSKPATHALAGGTSILLELPERIQPPTVHPALDALAGAGLRVIIAHPERNPYIQRNHSYVCALIEAGCFLQLTARSIEGGFGPEAKATAAHILRQRQAHFVASDAHGADARRPGLATTFQAISKRYGEPAARLLLIDNPEAAVRGWEIHDMPPAQGWVSAWFNGASQRFGRAQEF